MLRRINSKIALKIAILVIIEIILIIGSFGVLAFFESPGSSLGNSINIAGKNRYLTANLLLQTERYLDGSSDVSKLKGAIDSFQLNLISLKDGGTISGLELRPLPSEFLNLWNTIDLKWNIYKTSITDKIIIPSQEGKAITTWRKSRQEFTEPYAITNYFWDFKYRYPSSNFISHCKNP